MPWNDKPGVVQGASGTAFRIAASWLGDSCRPPGVHVHNDNIIALDSDNCAVRLAQFTGAANVGLYRGARRIIDATRYSFQPLMDAA